MDHLLGELLRQLKQYQPQTEAWQNTLSKVVEITLRSRPICRPFNRQPLFGVYLEIYQEVQQELFGDISENLPSYNSERMNARSWANQLQKDAFKKVLERNQMNNLVLEAQKHPPRSQLRQYALGELWTAIQISGRLCHPHQNSVPAYMYELVYQEALSRTHLYICRHINDYDPRRSPFMTWVNFRLDRTFIDVRNELTNQNIQYFEPESLKNMVSCEDSISLSEAIRQYIEEDPEHIFISHWIKNRPDANFRAIALDKFMGKTWQELSTEFNLSIPTISGFYYRGCESFRHRFREFL